MKGRRKSEENQDRNQEIKASTTKGKEKQKKAPADRRRAEDGWSRTKTKKGSCKGRLQTCVRVRAFNAAKNRAPHPQTVLPVVPTPSKALPALSPTFRTLAAVPGQSEVAALAALSVALSEPSVTLLELVRLSANLSERSQQHPQCRRLFRQLRQNRVGVRARVRSNVGIRIGVKIGFWKCRRRQWRNYRPLLAIPPPPHPPTGIKSWIDCTVCLPDP